VERNGSVIIDFVVKSVDAEINVAELVADNNLCPHQDYIYFSMPTDD